jgi:Protein of unknown function (DUF3572)
MKFQQKSLTPDGAELIALQALSFIAADAALGPRFLALTGLDAESLRRDAGTRPVLAAALDFLAGSERDLVACAEAIGSEAELFAAARGLLTP